jgi:hypothetical protein
LPGDDQCYWIDVFLFLPTGADETQWQFCLLDGTLCACSDFEDPASDCWWCTDATHWNDSGGYYGMRLFWPGLCSPIAGDDSREFYAVVRSATATAVTECETYHMQLEMRGQQKACPPD